jgi:cytochrome c-type biogenesis protein CcmH/NrfG
MAWSEIILFILAIQFFALGGFALLATVLRFREKFFPRGLYLSIAGIAGLGLSIASAATYENLAHQRAHLSTQPSPTRGQIAAAREMTPEARREMIEGMVSRLAARLRENPKDLAGWLRLGRAYGVLGRRLDALKAYAEAKQYYPSESKRIDQLIGELAR